MVMAFATILVDTAPEIVIAATVDTEVEIVGNPIATEALADWIYLTNAQKVTKTVKEYVNLSKVQSTPLV